MNTIVNNANDYASIISELTGKNHFAITDRDLCKVCEEAAPILCDRTIDAISAYREPCYAPTVHIAISKKNSYAMDDFFKAIGCDRYSDYCYLDAVEYDEYDSIDDVPSDKVDFTFIIDDLSKLETLINDVAKKLSELGEDTDFILNYLVPMDEGAIEYENGEREVGDPSLVWEIRDGQVKNPNAKIVIFGSDREALLYYGSILVPNVLEAEWKRIFNVDVTVEI
jgi:hypothetical protein